MIKTVGSICSGIEAASVAWLPLGFDFLWFSEIAKFQSMVLEKHYPHIPNLGDMKDIPDLIRKQKIECPDLICGGTPCQAFSFSGWRQGLNDDRGNLTLKFVDVVDSNDMVRLKKGLRPTIIFWENVEGVLSDKTNAFGCLVSSLAGLEKVIEKRKWPTSGALFGPKRNVCWRVLDAKYFGVPQQRKRLYLLAGGKDFHPENVLLEQGFASQSEFPKRQLYFEKSGHHFQIFREYTDCLYSAYGTKWNGNAAANNGSLFVCQDGRLRRLTPKETERLMGFPDDYTLLDGCKKTNRYQSTGNSWAVPVVSWIGKRVIQHQDDKSGVLDGCLSATMFQEKLEDGEYYDLGKESQKNLLGINSTMVPEKTTFGDLKDIVEVCQDDSLFLSPTACYGILRRRDERGFKLNPELEKVLQKISSKESLDSIEKKSRIQKRGRFSKNDI